MSKALQCDRCGAYYNKNEYQFRDIYPNFQAEHIRVTVGNINNVKTEALDLCDSCADSLDTWYYYGKPENQTYPEEQ